MQKLAKHQQQAATRSPRLASTRSEAGGMDATPVASYQKQLDVCTSAMLQYEWAWMEEHITDLEFCLNQPEMLEEVGGQAHVETMLSESRACQEALKRTMMYRNVEPARPSHAVVSGEHAWELSQENIKKKWGWEK